ncbi:hypothetical protein BGX26_011508 [Mortierella sp. AD094]|nr:hypothetical protein BGX26_011508 [Mortierella sp. AD094]
MLGEVAGETEGHDGGEAQEGENVNDQDYEGEGRMNGDDAKEDEDDEEELLVDNHRAYNHRAYNHRAYNHRAYNLRADTATLTTAALTTTGQCAGLPIVAFNSILMLVIKETACAPSASTLKPENKKHAENNATI